MQKTLVRKNNRMRGGFSLIELMVAMALSVLVVSFVYYSWNTIMHHTITGQQKSIFQTDVDRFSQSLASQLRASPEVLSIKDNSITFLSGSSTDTITYELTNGNLNKNGSPVTFVAPGTFVSQFSIEQENHGTLLTPSKTAMITLTITAQDKFGNTSTIPLQVRITSAQHELKDDFSNGLGSR